MACTPTRPDTRSWLPWHRQRLDAHCPAGPNPTVPFCPVHVGQTSSSGQTGPSPAGMIESSDVPKFLTRLAVLGRAGEDAHPYAVLVRPPLTSIIKVSFRPPRPLGIPWLRRRGLSLDAVPRVRVETPAPPVLGKETAGIRLLVSFLGFAELNIIGLTGLCKSSWPAANAYSDRQIRPTDYRSTDFDHGPL